MSLASAEECLGAEIERGSIDDQLVALIDRHETRLYRFLIALLGNTDAAHDCAQDTFVRAYDNLRKGKDIDPVTDRIVEWTVDTGLLLAEGCEMRTTTRFWPECPPLVIALLIVAGSSMATAGVPSAQARNWVQAGQQLAPGGTALATIASTGCATDAARLPARTRRGYYVPFVTNGPPPGNPNQTGYLFDHRVSGPIAQGSWSTVVYGPRLGSQHSIPSFQWVEIQGAFCAGVFWERQWQYWQHAPAIVSATTSVQYQLRACRAVDLRVSAFFNGATQSLVGGVAITNRSAGAPPPPGGRGATSGGGFSKERTLAMGGSTV